MLYITLQKVTSILHKMPWNKCNYSFFFIAFLKLLIEIFNNFNSSIHENIAKLLLFFFRIARLETGNLQIKIHHKTLLNNSKYH